MLESSYKVVLLGEPNVGKLDIINTFVGNTFNTDSMKTLSAQFVKKTIDIQGKSITFDIFDTAGQEKFSPLAKIFYKDAKVIIFVYDITNKESFDKIKNYWYEEVKKNGVTNVILAVVGNKCDLYDNQQVSDNEGKEFAESINAIFALTTNKSDTGVKKLFKDIAKKIVDTNYDYSNKEEKMEEEEYKKRKENKLKEDNNNEGKKKEKCIIF